MFAASLTSGFATFPPTETVKMANVMNLMCSPDETQTDTSRSTDDKQINSISRDLNPDQRNADGFGVFGDIITEKIRVKENS